MTRFVGLILALVLVVGFAWAKKGGNGGGGGGGGGGTPPPGTILFQSGSAYTMDANGENVVALSGIGGPMAPSWLEHADGSGGLHRWFLRWQSGGSHGVYAKREDGSVEILLLANADGVLANKGEAPGHLRWAKDDSFISFIGTDATGEGIFRAAVAFDADGEPYLTAAPEALVYEDPNVILQHDWSASGDQFVYFAYLGSEPQSGGFGSPIIELHVGTVAGDGSVSTAYLTDGKHPEWSPADDRIAYLYHDNNDHPGVATIHSDGTGYTEITPAGNARSVILRAHWSPDGEFLAHGKAKITNNYSGGQGFGTAQIFRVPSSGGSAVEITPSGFEAPILMGWR